MEVILLDKVGRLGVIGDKVTVKSGYGRNYLLPQGKAVAATAKNITALWYACNKEHWELVDKMIKLGARAFDAGLAEGPIRGLTALLIAMYSHQWKLVAKMISVNLPTVLTY